MLGFTLDGVDEARRKLAAAIRPVNDRRIGEHAAEVLEPFLADMTQQIDRGLQFFFSAASQYTSVDQLILAGGCAQIPDVDRFIEGRLRIPTVVAKPFSTLTVTSRAKPGTLFTASVLINAATSKRC